MRYRVTGLAAEAAFFAILSLPPLIFGLAGSIGYLVKRVDGGQIDDLRDQDPRAVRAGAVAGQRATRSWSPPSTRC